LRGIAVKETVPFVRRLPGADLRFDAPEDLSLKLLFDLGGEQFSDGEPFYCRKSDSLRDLTTKLSVCSIAKTCICLIGATGPGKAGQEDSHEARQGYAEGNQREFDRAVTALSKAKACDFGCMDFSKKPRVLDPRDFADVWIDQLLLASGQFAAIKLSGRKREEFLLVCTEIAALKTQVRAS
jgi:hypothetical protein